MKIRLLEIKYIYNSISSGPSGKLGEMTLLFQELRLVVYAESWQSRVQIRPFWEKARNMLILFNRTNWTLITTLNSEGY